MMKKFYLILTCAALCACGGNGNNLNFGLQIIMGKLW